MGLHYEILNLYNFSDQTIQVIKSLQLSLQKNSLSKILQKGHSYQAFKSIQTRGSNIPIHLCLISEIIRDCISGS